METSVAAAAAVARLIERRETLATAESLTGGLVASTVVEIPGVSAVYRGGLVVYATELKALLAGVPGDLLAERGPVDAEMPPRPIPPHSNRRGRPDRGYGLRERAGGRRSGGAGASSRRPWIDNRPLTPRHHPNFIWIDPSLST